MDVETPSLPCRGGDIPFVLMDSKREFAAVSQWWSVCDGQNRPINRQPDGACPSISSAAVQKGASYVRHTPST